MGRCTSSHILWVLKWRLREVNHLHYVPQQVTLKSSFIITIIFFCFILLFFAALYLVWFNYILAPKCSSKEQKKAVGDLLAHPRHLQWRGATQRRWALKEIQRDCPDSAEHPFCYTVIDSQKGLPITDAGPSRAAPSATGHPKSGGPHYGPCFPIWSSHPHWSSWPHRGSCRGGEDIPPKGRGSWKGVTSLLPSSKVWLCLLCSQSGFLFRRGMSFLKGYKCDSKGFLDIKWLIKKGNFETISA